MASGSADDLPAEILQNILSLLTWRQQMGVRRVSRRWRAAADACLMRCRELHVGEGDLPAVLDGETLEWVLQIMPSLSSLRVTGAKRRDALLELSRYLVTSSEVSSLVSFRVDRRAVERLCASCPRLEALTLPGKTDDTCVETLLRRLPNLRALHLVHTRVEGACLELLPPTLERLTLAGSRCLWTASIGLLARCPQLRELDMSRSLVCGDELALVVAACPLLERLSVAHCPDLQTAWLRQLVHCPQLRELDVSGLCVALQADMDGLAAGVAACTRLERLSVAELCDPQWYLPSSGLPALTYLDATNILISDFTLKKLPDLAPGLRTLKIQNCRITDPWLGATNDRLSRCLSRLRHLQSLNMLDTKDTTTPDTLDRLHSLPLRSLACGRLTDPVAADSVAGLVVRCSTLTFLQLGAGDAAEVTAALDLLVAKLPRDRDVILSVQPDVAAQLPPLPPGPLRVVDCCESPWEEV